MPQQAPLAVDCPACGRSVSWTAESLFRPFCSERCRMVDLGSWASEAYTIEGPSLGEDFQEIDPSVREPSDPKSLGF